MGKVKSLASRVGRRLHLAITNITIEPVLFLIYFTSSMDTVTVDQMVIEKACLNDFHYPEDVCDNLVDGNHTEENDIVQDEVRRVQLLYGWSN